LLNSSVLDLRRGEGVVSEYKFTEFAGLKDNSTFALLQERHPDLSQADIEWALTHPYQIFTLWKASQLVGVAGVHVYPHLSDTKRAWIHDWGTMDNSKDNPESFGLKSVLITNLRNQCLSAQCSELAIHVPVDNAIENQFFLQEAGQPFALVYQWTSSSWLQISEQQLAEQQISEQTVPNTHFQCRELKTLEDVASGLPLLKHFHPMVTQATLTDAIGHAIGKNYRVFGPWVNEQLCSIATLIHYPHLKNGLCVWLQDGMTLPTKQYKETASSLFSYVMNACFRSGSPTVTVHAKVSNKRIHRFYEAAGGQRIANAYKWRTIP
jgi:hypothetical protein